MVFLQHWPSSCLMQQLALKLQGGVCSIHCQLLPSAEHTELATGLQYTCNKCCDNEWKKGCNETFWDRETNPMSLKRMKGGGDSPLITEMPKAQWVAMEKNISVKDSFFKNIFQTMLASFIQKYYWQLSFLYAFPWLSSTLSPLAP